MKNILHESQNAAIQLTSTADLRVAFFISKNFLKNFKQVDIHALGSAIDGAVICAERLQRHGLATINKIETLTETIEEEKQKVKIIISLKITENGQKILNEQNLNMKFV